MKERQLAVAIYLINKLTLRVGIEKDSGDGADTVRFNLTPVFLVVCLFCLKILFNASFSHQFKSPQGPQGHFGTMTPGGILVG